MKQEVITKEKFEELIKEDKWISRIADPVTCCDKNLNFKHYRTCSYPVEYIVSEEQIQIAKALKEKRKKEILSDVEKGGCLMFVTMGGDFESKLENGVGNYRIRCNFTNSKGRRFFVEFMGDPGSEGDKVWCDFSIDLDLRDIRKKEIDEACKKRAEERAHYPILDKQDYYNAFKLEKKDISMPYTLDAICDLINKVFGCNYKRCGLIDYFINADDFINHC